MTISTPLRLVPLLAGAVLAAACATSPRAVPAPEPGLALAPPGRIYDSTARLFVGFERMADELARTDVVFLGEQHDDPATHELELAVLRALGTRRDKVVLSLEMFERDVQGLIDAYLAGRISEDSLLAASRPWPRYASDYRALVQLAKENRWPVIASNIPRWIASNVSRSGLGTLDSLSETQRSWAAREISCPRDRYYDRFEQQMQSHGGGAGGDPASARAVMQRYYEAQCIKDETMAESIVAALDAAGPGAIVLHVNGAFHSDYGLGTVDRVLRRRPGLQSRVVSAIPVPDPSQVDVQTYAGRGDYLIFLRRQGPGLH